MNTLARTQRRRFLQMLSTSGIAAFSGCSGVSGLLSTLTPRLLAIGIINHEDVAHTTSVRLRKDGETDFEATHELGTDGGKESYLWRDDQEWSDITEYSYAVQVDDGEWKTLELGQTEFDSDTNCALLVIDIHPFDTDAVNGHFEPRSCDWSASN